MIVVVWTQKDWGITDKYAALWSRNECAELLDRANAHALQIIMTPGCEFARVVLVPNNTKEWKRAAFQECGISCDKEVER